MNFRTFLLLVFGLCVSFLMNGQIRFSETIQSSKIANADDNALYFIDFWATWCVPCVYATEYLEVLQKQYPNHFYVVSLSEENPDKVRRSLQKRPTDLAVSIDYEGETFNKNNIRVLPYGILLNAKGKILWKGSPTDFKASDLNRFLKQNKSLASFDDVFKIESTEDNQVFENYIPKEDFEIKQLKKENFETLEISSIGNYILYKGDLKSIIAKVKRILKSQVKIAPELNKTYEVYIKKGTSGLFSILDELKLDLFHSETQGEVIMLDISNINYWDTQQIDWGKNTAEYLIDDTQIQGDNVTFKDVMFQLASVLNLPLVTKGNDADEGKHDWQIHHRFYNLMQTNLEDTYGIKVTKEKGKFKAYTIRKKTP